MDRSKELLFGVTKKKSTEIKYMSDAEYELYLINNTDFTVTLKQKSFGGFTTHDDTVLMVQPQETDADVIIPPRSYILYGEMYEDDFSGAGQYQAVVEIEGIKKQLEFYNRDCTGFFGSELPVLKKYGKLVYPHISDC